MQNAFNGIYNKLAVVGPALVITLTILSLILFGNALSDALQSSAEQGLASPPPAPGAGCIAEPGGCRGPRRMEASAGRSRAAHRLPDAGR